MINIIFDMDGVLFDTQKLYVKAWHEVADILGIPNITEPAYLCIGRSENDQSEVLDKYYPEGFPYEEFKELKRQKLMSYVEKEVPLMKGTKELLEYLKSIGARVAIASSTRRPVIEHHLQLTGLSKYFEKIISGDLVTHSKPAPDIYLMACKELGVEPSDTFAIEDSYNGIRSAAAAGLKTIMIPDMQPYNDEMAGLVHGCHDNLLDFMNYLKTI